jgi:sulfite exporter TauE/SafE
MLPDTADVLSLFMLGFLGAGHCLGMCGPLVIALPGRFDRWNAHLVYHLGRLSTYTLIGVILGAIGGGFPPGIRGPDTPLSWLAHLQVALSVLAAVFLVLFGLMRMGILREPDWMAGAGPAKIPGFGRAMHGAMQQKKIVSLFWVGLMLGMLPCGLSYAAFARALAAPGGLSGGLLAFCFGIGTLPGLLLLGTGASAFFRRHRTHMEIVAGLIMIIMGVSLIMKIAA